MPLPCKTCLTVPSCMTKIQNQKEFLLSDLIMMCSMIDYYLYNQFTKRIKRPRVMEAIKFFKIEFKYQDFIKWSNSIDERMKNELSFSGEVINEINGST